MNFALDEAQLEAFGHMNRAQKRAFILRDQLQYTEPHHLDAFVEGISNPEPPPYKRTSNGIQPPFDEVTIKDSATRFDLGNVELKDKSIRRVHLTCVGDSYEIHDSDAIPQDEDDLNSVPINYYVAQKTMPKFKAKYEAIYERVRSINDMRRHLYEQARNKPPKTPTRFKEGKSLVKLMDSGKDNEGFVDGGESHKRPGELVTRHPLNKKKRISLGHVSNKTKAEAVNKLPDQTKVEFFNAFVKSAFPDFDNLLMASWNVVSIYVSVGSEDLMLHNSIGDLHDVLMKFDQYFGKAKKAQRPDMNGSTNADSRNNGHSVSLRKDPAAQGFGTLDGGVDMAQSRAHDRLIELPLNNREDTGDGAPPRPTPFTHGEGFQQLNGRYEAEHRPQLDPRQQHRASLELQSKQSPVRQPETPDQSVAKQSTSRSRTDGCPLPQSLVNLFTYKTAKDSRRDPHDTIPEIRSGIDEGYVAMQKQKPQTPLIMPSLDKPSSKTNNNPTRTPVNDSLRRPKHVQRATEPAEHRNLKTQQQSQPQTLRQSQRYGMFNRNSTHHDSIDSLFVGDDDDDEAVEVPAMQEVHEQEDGSVKHKSISLGNSLLGVPRRVPNSMGNAPVAPMMHNSPADKTGEAERRT